MPSAMTGQLHIGLSKSGIALVHRRGWLRPSSHLLGQCSLGGEPAGVGVGVPEAEADAEVTVERLASKLDQLLSQAACRRLPTRLVLADHWSRQWMVSPPANARRPADCRAGAAARFQALYAEPPGAWQLAADWHASRPFLAVALPTALLGALRQVCDRHQLSQRDVVTQFVAGWNYWRHALQPGAWFAVVHGASMTLGAVVAGRLSAIRSLALPAQAAPGWLATAVRREALRWLIEPPRLLQCCGDWPAAWGTGVTGASAATQSSDGADRAVRVALAGAAPWACRRLDDVLPAVDLAKGLQHAGQPALRLAATGR